MKERRQPEARAPRAGLQLMGVILIVMALLAIYSNVQHARRDQIETVTITPLSATPSPSPSPSPLP